MRKLILIGLLLILAANVCASEPNVLLIVLDAVSADHLSLYGYPLNTSPNIDKFAEESVVFDDAVSVGAFSLTSYASMFTGRYPSSHKASKSNQYLSETEVTLEEVLRGKGYNTIGFPTAIFTKEKYGFAQGFNQYKDRLDFFEYSNTYQTFSIRSVIRLIFPIFEEKILKTDGQRTAEELNKDVFRWLEKNKDEKFFMFMTYIDAHAPYKNDKFKHLFTNETRDYEEVREARSGKRGDNVSQGLVDYIVNLYDAEIFYLDKHFQKLLDKLDELGIKDNTIIILVADHGEEFYEHYGFGHSATLYEEIIHVPFIIHYPKEFKPQRIERRIGTINIFPTVLDILGITIPGDIDSISLVPLLIQNKRLSRG